MLSFLSHENVRNLKVSFKQYQLYKHYAPQFFSTQQQVLQVELRSISLSLYSAVSTGFAPGCLKASLPSPD